MSSEPANLTIDGYPFVCVPLWKADFSDAAAVYVVICVSGDGNWKVIDVGQTGELGRRIDDHDRRECWLKSCRTHNIWVCVYRMPSDRYSKQDRLGAEQSIRRKHSPPCGTR